MCLFVYGCAPWFVCMLCPYDYVLVHGFACVSLSMRFVCVLRCTCVFVCVNACVSLDVREVDAFVCV